MEALPDCEFVVELGEGDGALRPRKKSQKHLVYGQDEDRLEYEK